MLLLRSGRPCSTVSRPPRARLFAQASVKSPPKLEDGRTERKEGEKRGNCNAAGVFDKVQAHRCQCATRVGALPDAEELAWTWQFRMLIIGLVEPAL